MNKRENELTWRDLEIGSIVTEPGSASQYKTGDWRSQKPTYKLNKCIKCGLCWIFCPESCIKQDDEGYFIADLYHCYGCGICAKECPTGVITMIEEEE
ncbi:4Fe-4S binding protein [Chloroflexota bacterium]